MHNHNIQFPIHDSNDYVEITNIVARPLKVTEAQAKALTKARECVTNSIDDQSSELYAALFDLASVLLSAADSYFVTGGILGKVGGLLKRNAKQKRDLGRVRKAVAGVWVRLLDPELNYVMHIADVNTLCREIWLTDDFSMKFIDQIYDRVILNLEAGDVREYCRSQELMTYFNAKVIQVGKVYVAYKVGGTLTRLISRVGT